MFYNYALDSFCAHISHIRVTYVIGEFLCGGTNKGYNLYILCKKNYY